MPLSKEWIQDPALVIRGMIRGRSVFFAQEIGCHVCGDRPISGYAFDFLTKQGLIRRLHLGAGAYGWRLSVLLESVSDVLAENPGFESVEHTYTSDGVVLAFDSPRSARKVFSTARAKGHTAALEIEERLFWPAHYSVTIYPTLHEDETK